MKYTIISRDELLKLIKFGTIDQNINYIVDEKNQQKFIKEVLKSLPYDDPFGYVVIEFAYEESFSISNIQTLVKLDIKDIINIYCLTNEALDFYKSKFNPKIKFKLFENQGLIKEIDSYKLIEDKKKGIKALFDIFDLEQKDINEKFNTEYINELLNYKENNYLEQEYKNFYFDLFCYERKNSFYKEDVGFIADIRVISKMKNIRKDKELFLSGNYVNLSNQTDREKIKFTLKKLVIDSIDKINQTDKKTEEEKKETARNLIIGTIFLKSQQLLNTESREQNYWGNFINLVNEFKEDFLDEIKEALWYLGVFLGYKYLYDDYYNFLDLNIFKEDLEFSNVLTNEEESENELAKLKQENEELSKKITHLESSQNKNIDSESIKDKNNSNQTDFIDSINQENEQLKKQLDEKLQREKELKEEIERKNKELKEIQQQKDDSKSSELDNKFDNIDTMTETEEPLSNIADQKVEGTYSNNLYDEKKQEYDSITVNLNELRNWKYPHLITFAFAINLDGLNKTKLESKYSKDNQEELCKAIINNQNLISK